MASALIPPPYSVANLTLAQARQETFAWREDSNVCHTPGELEDGMNAWISSMSFWVLWGFRTRETAVIRKPVDMSSNAIDKRLCELAQLCKLGMSLRGAKRVGTAKELLCSPAVVSDDKDAKRPQ